jgi:DNA repair photolyase
MPLKKAEGNMYDWVSHTWNCILGECPHRCLYCYVKTSRWTRDNPLYKGPLRFNLKDEKINLGSDKTIFVCHTNDLFLADKYHIIEVLKLCNLYSGNKYIFQTKDPLAALKYYFLFPEGSYLGTTIETDKEFKISNAPPIESRLAGIRQAKKDFGIKTFITVEPILSFTPYFAAAIKNADPDWINIGADSKYCNLPEPTKDELIDFIDALRILSVVIRKKSNLERLLRG